MDIVSKKDVHMKEILNDLQSFFYRIFIFQRGKSSPENVVVSFLLVFFWIFFKKKRKKNHYDKDKKKYQL